MKEDKYILKGLCEISYRDVQRFAQIYKALYGDAMLVSLLGAQIHLHVWPLETNS